MKKNDRLESWLDAWDNHPGSQWPREYRAFFARFNQGDFYEAHDVLEHLWLRCTDSSRSFFQALIQLAGAFVHFQKHALYPNHPTHSRRIPPGSRLLDLAVKRLQSFPSPHLGVDPSEIIALSELWKSRAHPGTSPLVAFPRPRLTEPQDEPQDPS